MGRVMKEVFCTILIDKFSIEYNSEGLSEFKCPYVYVNKNKETCCDYVKYRKCPVHNLINRIAKIDERILDKLVKNQFFSKTL